MASSASPTRRPWRVTPHPERDRIWIEGPEGSAATGSLPADRRIVCDFALYGDPATDAETEANMDLIVEAVNARGDA